MCRFFKYILGFLIPILLMLCLYIFCDPFKVIWHYDNYYADGGGEVNRSFVSTMNYLNKKDKYHYNSFIFGNSRSLFYMIDDWKKYIPQKSSCYHFSESGGTIDGILYKLILIDSLNENIDLALFVIDSDLLQNQPQELNENTLLMMPPALIHNNNWIHFQLKHFLKWTNPKFIFYYTKYRLTGKYESNMKSYISKGDKYYNPISNQECLHTQDSLIAHGVYYDENRIEWFKDKQHPSISIKLLNDSNKINNLKAIKQILTKHKTKYKIILSPLYSQVKVNSKDLQLLESIFGHQNVYDFSGVNQFTSDYHNYYESSHYRKEVCAQIMDYIYNH